MKFFSFSNLPDLPSNIFQFNHLITNNTDSEEEVAPFKLNIEDVMENQQLKQALVSFHCLKIQNIIGHGEYLMMHLPHFSLECISDYTKVKKVNIGAADKIGYSYT